MLHVARPIALLVIAALCCGGGCDAIHGVSRSLPVAAFPRPGDVEQAIWATPGVTEMNREFPPQTTASTNDGKTSDLWQFVCRDTTSAVATVECSESSEAGKRVSVYCYWMNHVPSDLELSNVRALIGRICVSLHQRAPAVPDSSSADDQIFR